MVIVAILGAVVPLAPVGLDETMLVKAALVLTAVTVWVAWVLAGWFSRNAVAVPAGPSAVALGAFAVVVVAAVAWSPSPALSSVGAYERYTGGLLYAAYALLGLAVMTWTQRRDQLVGWLLTAAAGVVGYGLIQLAGWDPVEWQGRFGDEVIAQFGNPDFVSGYLGIVLPLAIWGAGWSDWRIEWRMVSAVVSGCVVVVLFGTGATQGLVNAGVGVAALGVAVAARGGGARARRVLAAASGLGLGTASLVLAGAAGLGPATSIWEISTIRSRTYLWDTALAMIRAEPLTGVGLGQFGRYYHEFRPLDEAVRRDLDRAADAAHNVLLNLAAGGGVIVAATWLAVAIVTAVALVRAWRHGDSERRTLVGAFGGAWLAYHVQASVSLDVTPVAATHFVLVGAIAGLAPGSSVRRLRPEQQRPGRFRRGLLTAALSAPVVVLVAIVVVADQLAGLGADAGARDDHEAGIARTQDAVSLAPWQPEYHFERARVLARAGRLEAAVEAMDDVLDRDPRDLAAWISRGRLLTALDRPLAAVEAYASARVIAPKSPELGVEYAEALAGIDQTTLAREVLLGVLAAVPDYQPALDLLDDL